MNEPTRSELRYVDVPGAQLGYEVVGEGSGKPPLVMVHGYSLRSTGPLYGPLFAHLSQAFTIYALDTRGHGGSAQLIDGWTFDRMAHDVAAVVTRLGLARPVYAGHSYGGFLGLVTELQHPGMFSALCLMAPAAASGGSATPPEVQSTITHQGRDRAVMKSLFEQMYVAPPAPEHLGRVLDAVTLMHPQVHDQYFGREYRNINIVAELPAIRAPVLSVTGARDVIVSPAEQRATAAAMPNAKEVMFSDQGHMLPLEAPDRVAREVVRFVEDLS